MSNNPSITTLSINGLNGRLMSIPSKDKNNRHILLIYGVHSSLERMQSTAEFLSHYGNVTMPDLPGLGGMDSFYIIDLRPTLDAYADYLKSYLAKSKLGGPVTVVAMSFGFLVLTRMLQKYPDMKSQFGPIISFVGFGSANDFQHHTRKRILTWPLFWPLSTGPGSWIVSKLVFNPVSLRAMFGLFKLFNPKYKHGMATNPEASIKMELNLWQQNDARTRFNLYLQLLNFDLTKGAELIDCDLHNMKTPTDQYFVADKVTISLKKLYKSLSQSTANMALHAPSVIGTTDEVTAIFSDEVKAILKSGKLK